MVARSRYCLVVLVAMCSLQPLCAQPKPERAASRFGQFITITNPVNDAQVALVNNVALRMQAQSDREQREAFLVLEIRPGSSRFGQVADLASALTDAQVSGVRTIAWIPETVKGNHAVIALACHEIVMAPNAALGDIGRGDRVSDVEQNFVFSIVDRRRNSRVSRGVVAAMMDPAAELLRVDVKTVDGGSEQRFLTSTELQALHSGGAIISDTQIIKDSGAPGLFNAVDSESIGFLVTRTEQSRRDVAATYDLPIQSMREIAQLDKPLNVRVIAVHGPIMEVMEDFVLRKIRTAVAEGANLLIFDIDSPGGYLHSSLRMANTIADLDARRVSTVAWIAHDAISGAAVVSLGCDQIIMRPEAKIGDAGVIAETAEGGAFADVPQKIDSPFMTDMASLAKKKNRPRALLQAMVDKDLKVYRVTHPETGRVTYMSDYDLADSSEAWVKGPLVPESREGFLLTLSGVRAHELGLAEAPCDDMNELRSRLGIPTEVSLAPDGPSWVDSLVFLLNTSGGGFILITIAILCLYVELHLPSGFFGILSAGFFGLYFWSRYLGGTAGTLEMMMFLFGLVLLAIEIFLIPGFGVFGVSGIAMLLGSLIMASHTFAGMTAGERFEESLSSLGTLAGSMVTVMIVAVVLNRFLPSIPILNRLILTPPGYAEVDGNTPHLRPDLNDQTTPGIDVEVGEVGVAASTLRPSGKATFGDLFVDVYSDGGYIDHGDPIEVIRIAGKRIIVRPASQDRA